MTSISFSLEASCKSCSKFSNSFTEELKLLIMSSKNFFSFTIFWAYNLSFQKFSCEILLSNSCILLLILFFSKIPPNIIYYFFNF